MIDDVEPFFPLGIIGAANIDQATEATERIVAQEGDDLLNRVALGLDPRRSVR
jgi:hypothetical protein